MSYERPESGYWCITCHKHYGEEEEAEDCCMLDWTIPADCDCYVCEEPVYKEDEFGEMLYNNMKHHTFMQVCEECGGLKTEHKDLGTKGLYICPCEVK